MKQSIRVLFVVAVGLLAACEYTTTPASKGGPGESCLARNDCGGGLSCINRTCVDSEVPIDISDKQCDLVQCTEKADCCGEDEECRCVDDVCETVLTCDIDSDCFGFGLAACDAGECVECADDADCGFDGTCANNRCVECDSDADCGDDEVCTDSLCQSGCTRDEDCGALQACEDASCVDKDCDSDRECIAYLSSPRAKCGDDGECTVECESDAECNSMGFDFSKCDDGICRFLGCDTNADCRAYFGDSAGNRLALCRDPEGSDD